LRSLNCGGGLSFVNSLFTYILPCVFVRWAINGAKLTAVIQIKEMMAKKSRTRKLKPIERCPNGHPYNTGNYGEICPVCGKKLDPPTPDSLTPEELYELTHVNEKDWPCGWLVCIGGPNKGDDYKIREGRNFIGGDLKMDIIFRGIS